MNQLAIELNEIIGREGPHALDLLSSLGKELYFPKGIIDQTAQAKAKANRFNATIGIAKENGKAMFLPSLTRYLDGLGPDESLAYPPTDGILQLRNAWREHQHEVNPSMRGKSMSLPVVTCGLTHGLNLCAEMFCDPGDAVLLPDMLWGNYNMVYGIRRGCNIVNYRFFDDAGNMDLDSFENALASLPAGKKAVMILNYPNNPTGYTPTPLEAKRLCDILTREAENGRGMVVICDDAYFGFFYEDNSLQESLFGMLCGLHPRILAVKLDGATKENYAWGLRIGFLALGATGPAEDSEFYWAMNRKLSGAIRSSVSCNSMLAQSLVLKSLTSPDFASEKLEKFEVMKSRYDKVKEALAEERYAQAWRPFPFNSGYFMCLRLVRGKADETRLHLLDEYGVGVISLGENDIRVAFSCIEEYEVQELFDLLYNAVMEV